jgi:hypothetical protein
MNWVDWQLFYQQLQISARETKERLKLRPGVTVCPSCQAPQLGSLCERCKESKDCFGYGNLCCVCCEIDAIEMNALVEDGD